jgi:NADPH-dependent ferric siderophore reductase
VTTAATRPATGLRRAVVRATERPTPRVLRVTLAGPDLADLPLAAPDGYLKMRRHVVRERGVDKRDVCFTGYWRRGRTEEQEVRAAMEGSAPTDE